jgi:RNA polymerase sigma-70 factor (ECF subfamily)
VSVDPALARNEFEELAFVHLSALHSFAYRLTRNPKDAEDLVQETFLRAYRFFDKYQRGTNVKAWLFRILKNTFINEYRRRKAQPAEVDFDKLEGAYEKQLEELSSTRVENPETALERTLMTEDIEEAISTMPEEYRMVVLLCLVEGFTYQEAADALEIPVGTVMSRLHRGRKHLQSRLLVHARSRGFGSPADKTDGDDTT